jgi:hypothetical protein
MSACTMRWRQANMAAMPDSEIAPGKPDAGIA